MSHNLLKLLSFLCITTLLASACRKPTSTVASSTKKTLENYYVRYSKSEGALHSDAVVLEGDSLQNAKVKPVTTFFFGDQEMKKATLPNGAIQYSYDNTEPYKKEFIFRYNSQNQQISNTVVINKLDSFAIKGIASKSKDLLVEVSPTTLFEPSESVMALISDSKGATATIVLTAIKNDGILNIPGSVFAHLANGKGTLDLIRKQQQKIQKDNREIQNNTEYYTPQIPVSIGN
ncbi:MAG: hypothetical protein KA974_04390 [Saprospiraceae bacterium]|nr:hypothetical protein [Saprospiraceae bacterium]MBP7679522.1 hypothetical protein [Saprospiraceae bacterium]